MNPQASRLTRNDAIQPAKYAKYAKEEQGESAITSRGIAVTKKRATTRKESGTVNSTNHRV